MTLHIRRIEISSVMTYEMDVEVGGKQEQKHKDYLNLLNFHY